MTPQLYTLSWLAQELCRDRRALARELEGLTPDEEVEHGARTERRWKLRRVFEHLLTQSAGEEDDDQRQRLAAAQADRYEMENEQRRGQLIEVSEAITIAVEHIGAARAKVLSMPTKCAPQLINVADPNAIESILRTEAYAVLDELADWVPSLGAPTSGGNGTHLEKPADDDGEPVGGRAAQA